MPSPFCGRFVADNSENGFTILHPTFQFPLASLCDFFSSRRTKAASGWIRGSFHIAICSDPLHQANGTYPFRETRFLLSTRVLKGNSPLKSDAIQAKKRRNRPETRPATTVHSPNLVLFEVNNFLTSLCASLERPIRLWSERLMV